MILPTLKEVTVAHVPTNSCEGQLDAQSPCLNDVSGAIKAVDLFSGCGGMSLGFQMAGFDIVAAFDNFPPAISVYRENFAHPIESLDLGSPEAVPAVSAFSPDLIIGGPPCQDFSSAGPLNSHGERANLTLAFANIVVSTRPQFFVFENVPRARLSKVFKQARGRLKQAGYGVTEALLNASLCGVPQTRKRFFLIGCLDERDGFLDDALSSGLSDKPMTMRDYFGDELGVDYYFRVPTNYSRRGIFSVDEPCTTIRAVDRPLPKGYKGHKDDPVPVSNSIRGLTVRERSRVQTFPEDFRLVGTKTNLNTLIGNAVPVNLAQYVARSLKEFIGGLDRS